TVPGWLRRLVTHRDGGRCQWVGCGHGRWLQVHHIQHWSQGGATDLDNLILLCGFHHRFVHEHDWHITTRDDGGFQFLRPDWTPYPKPQPGLHPRLAALVDTRPT
ncbi:MAG: HNH endonuclease, partial [Actinobacteria bacterium]|nr:HNH endonuclease [Actinomycetota bacterium]